VQENLQVPTVYPGVVYFRAKEVKPSVKKWAQVDVTGGKFEWNDTAAYNSRPVFNEKPKKWSDFAVADLEKIKLMHGEYGFSHALAGIGCSGAMPYIPAKSPYVQAKCALGRIFRRPKTKPWGGIGPMPGVWQKAKEFIDLLLPNFTAERMTDAAWLDSMEARRKRPLARAQDLYKRTGWMKAYEEFSAFIKTEFALYAEKNDGLNPGELEELKGAMERVIQGPHDVTHVIAGPHLKPLLQKLKEIWDVKFPIFYGSATPEKLHKFLQDFLVEGEGIAKQYFWMDFTNFENTHSADSWDFMETLYLKVGIYDPDFWKVMKCWRKPRGRIGVFKYLARIMNASGRDDTALANAILNGFASYLSAAAAYLGKPLMQLTVDDVRSVMPTIKLSVCGDDSLGTIPMHNEDFMIGFRKRMEENILMFGFETKLNTSTNLHEAVYLGMRPYPTQKGWFWGKTIGRATYKMGYVKLDKERDVMAEMTGIADMHVLCSSHVPILSDLAKKILELRQGAKRTPQVLDPNKPWKWTYQSGVDYDDTTLQAVADMYTTMSTKGLPVAVQTDVTVADVRGLIQSIQNIHRLPCVLDHWLWRTMIFVDDL